MKYFILGALSSGLLLYGMSMIYRRHGHARHHEVAPAVSRLAATTDRSSSSSAGFHGGGDRVKLGAAPFHMWIPDVYQAAPTAITLVIGSAAQARRVRDGGAAAGDGLLDLAQDGSRCWRSSAALHGDRPTSPRSRSRTQAHARPTRPSRTMGFMLLSGCCRGVVGGTLLTPPTRTARAVLRRRLCAE